MLLGLLRAVLSTGALLSATVLGAGVVAYHLGRPWQSIVFVVLGLAQLGIALAVRAPRRQGERGNPGLVLAIVLSAVLQVAGVLVPPLRALLGTQALRPADLAICALVAAVPALILTMGGRVSVMRSRQTAGSPPVPDPTSRTG